MNLREAAFLLEKGKISYVRSSPNSKRFSHRERFFQCYGVRIKTNVKKREEGAVCLHLQVHTTTLHKR